MRADVAKGIEELKLQFGEGAVTARDDGQGGAYVVVDPVTLGPKFKPTTTWIGFHVPAQYPYADIYPVFIAAAVGRADGQPFAVPITPGHSFEGRAAIQVSRRNAAAQNGLQKVSGKVLKIIHFLQTVVP